MQPTTMNTHTRTVEQPVSSEDRELKAYIYQQLTDLQPYLIADSQMAVSVHQVSGVQEVDPRNLSDDDIMEMELDRASMDDDVDDEDENRRQPEVGDYVVKLTTTLEGGQLVSQGCGADVFEAFGEAKGAMLSQLTQLQNALLDGNEREVEIQNYLNGSKTLH